MPVDTHEILFDYKHNLTKWEWGHHWYLNLYTSKKYKDNQIFLALSMLFKAQKAPAK